MPSTWFSRALTSILACGALVAVCVPSAQAAGSGKILQSGDVLGPGQSLTDGAYTLTMLPTGDLAETNQSGTLLWSTGTAGNPGSSATVAANGNLSVFSAAGHRIWQTAVNHPGTRAQLLLPASGILTVVVDTKVSWRNVLSGSSTIIPGTTLYPGQHLNSAQYSLQLTAAGTLVESAYNRTMWHTNTQTPGSRLSMQTDGTLVLRDPAGQTMWSAVSHVNNAAFRLGAAGQLIVGLPGKAPAWTYSSPYTHRLLGGDHLFAGQYVNNPRDFTHLVMQSDGNLVTYVLGKARWSSQTNGHPGAYFVMQTDGNAVVYDTAGHPLWNSVTQGHPGAFLSVQASGQAAVFAGGTVLKDMGGLGPASAGYYPFWDATCSTSGKAVDSSCPPYHWTINGTNTDPYGLPYRICASYVAWWLDAHGGDVSHVQDKYGADWGVKYAHQSNHTPTVGSLAYWPAGTSLTIGGTAYYFTESHVALVKVVHPDGTVYVGQFNANGDGTYTGLDHVRGASYIHLPF